MKIKEASAPLAHLLRAIGKGFPREVARKAGAYPGPRMASLDLLTFTLAIPSEVPSTQLISDLSNPYPDHHFSMVILTIGKWSFQSSHK